jgi:hypothetical protein
MKTWLKKETWKYSLTLVLSAIIVSCTAVSVFVQGLAQSMGEFLAALGVVAATCLLRLFILPPIE